MDSFLGNIHLIDHTKKKKLLLQAKVSHRQLKNPLQITPASKKRISCFLISVIVMRFCYQWEAPVTNDMNDRRRISTNLSPIFILHWYLRLVHCVHKSRFVSIYSTHFIRSLISSVAINNIITIISHFIMQWTTLLHHLFIWKLVAGSSHQNQETKGSLQTETKTKTKTRKWFK